MLTITKAMLQEHGVCSDGILTFKRLWSLPHTFHTLDNFEQALADNHVSFSWNDGVAKFNLPEDEYDTLWRSFSGIVILKAKAMAFARLFWYKFAGPQSTPVEEAAKAYLEALATQRKLSKVSPGSVTVSIEGAPQLFEKWIEEKLKTMMPTLVEEVKEKAAANVRQRQQELHTASDPA